MFTQRTKPKQLQYSLEGELGKKGRKQGREGEREGWEREGGREERQKGEIAKHLK